MAGLGDLCGQIVVEAAQHGEFRAGPVGYARNLVDELVIERHFFAFAVQDDCVVYEPGHRYLLNFREPLADFG
ncbi:hypothetical protein PSP31121_05297 [Pandoraea sputorum]|uniref:Uncharacterized protein n=1 Tax=Pandoraea sputorum TaxID=93222 RepID=A0A5E5BH79_9BURK|nr:hypothetical protein PSP31121_05297 [Pandoraea sputorum]